MKITNEIFNYDDKVIENYMYFDNFNVYNNDDLKNIFDEIENFYIKYYNKLAIGSNLNFIGILTDKNTDGYENFLSEDEYYYEIFIKVIDNFNTNDKKDILQIRFNITNDYDKLIKEIYHFIIKFMDRFKDTYMNYIYEIIDDKILKDLEVIHNDQ